MTSEVDSAESIYSPRFQSNASRRTLASCVRKLIHGLGRVPDDLRTATIRGALDRAIADRSSWPSADTAAIEASLRVLSDLVLQGWRLSVVERGIRLRRPLKISLDAQAEKERIREQELLKRDEQLATPAVRGFIKEMERRRVSGAGFHAIFTLFRDGRDLAGQLRKARGMAPDELVGLVDPYLVFVDEDGRCPVTGLRLMDVWRYFRHTWANQYSSVPGRTMMFLVRDRAVATHPVMGIGAISSPIVQIRERDTWIGWHPQVLLGHIRDQPTARVGAWLRRTVDNAIDEVYVQDFLESDGEDTGLLSLAEFRAPTPATIERLRAHGALRRVRHRQFPGSLEHKAKASSLRDGTWMERARTNLFTSKRATALAEFLEAREVLQRFLGDRPTKQKVSDLIADREGQRVVLRIARKAKGDRVGIAMADISVCGAVPPYGALLGGKLVAMLSASPEVVAAYRAKYRMAESEIASAMAGRSIRRPPDLVFFGTTSLYGRSSQYNRVSVPAERLGGAPGTHLRYTELGESESFGTSHFSEQTLRALDNVIRCSEQGKRVNNIFGEGTSPKLRKVRDGLTELGFAEDLLRHYRRRVIYGVSLVENLRNYLLGMDTTPKYLFSLSGEEATAAIAAWWRERWLCKRIQSDDVLNNIAAHNLTWPIRHGARVPLPPDAATQAQVFQDA